MDLVPGIYESVISDAMDVSLRSLSQGLTVDREPIPFEISDDVLSRYVQKVLKNGLAIIRDKALASVAEDDGSLYALKRKFQSLD